MGGSSGPVRHLVEASQRVYVQSFSGWDAERVGFHVMRVLAVANHKGGTGKTTTAVNLAACLAERGKRCVLLDLDPQAQASAWLGVHQDGAAGILDALRGAVKLADLVRPSPVVEGVAVLPASLALSGADAALVRETGRELLLKRALARKVGTFVSDMPTKDEHPVTLLSADYLLIDCPQPLGILTLNALAAADAVLIPCETTVLSLNALTVFMQSLKVVKARLNPGLKIAGIVPVRVRAHTNMAREVLALMRKQYAGDVLPVTIREATKAAEAPSHRKPLTLYARSHEVTQEYRKLATLILKGR